MQYYCSHNIVMNSIAMKVIISNKKNIVLSLLMLSFFQVSASEDVVLQKYIYGTREIDAEKKIFLPPVVRSLPNIDFKNGKETFKIYPYYEVSDNESQFEKNKNQVYIKLLVRQKINNVIANVIFYNKSKKTYFLHRSRLTEPKGSLFYPLCSDAFSIATDGISLVYQGQKCEFRDEDNNDKSVWVRIPAGKTFSYTVKLNDAYTFLPKHRRYNIGTLEHFFATDTFFYERKSSEYLFSILDWTYNACYLEKGHYYIENVVYLCEVSQWRKNTVRNLMRKFDFNGLSPSNYFQARSNQVVLEIDGDKLTTPYDTKSTKFSEYSQ